MRNFLEKVSSLRGDSADKAVHLHGSPRSLPALAMTKIKKLGFTLVELSIGIVIAGLLIGGILMGQSLIESAKISKTVAMIGQFDASVAAFKTKYKQLPGDFSFSGESVNGWRGNNDGAIDMWTAGGGASACRVRTSSSATNGFQFELPKFWADLSTFGALKTTNSLTTYKGISGNPYPFGTNYGSLSAAQLVSSGLPKIPLGKNISVIACGEAIGINYYKIGQWLTESDGTVSGSITESLTPAQAFAIDQKTDDGVVDTGNLVGYQASTFRQGLYSNVGTSANTTSCRLLANYDTASAAGGCSLSVRIGGRTNPQ